MQAWVSLHALFLIMMSKTKNQSFWVFSYDLYGENKLYKRKRFICLVLLLKSSFLDILASFSNDDRAGKKNVT